VNINDQTGIGETMDSINFAALNFVDIVILLVFLFSIIIGLGRGFVSEVLSLLVLVAAFAVAVTFTNPLANYFTNTETVQHVVNSTTTAVGMSTAKPISYAAIGISFAILFALTVIVGMAIKSVINLLFQSGVLGFGNRILGGVFGFARGYLINLVLIFLIQLSPLSTQSWWNQSQLVPLFRSQVVWLGNMVSPALSNLKSKIEPALQDVSESVKKLTQ
jgi:membrane protein required for colicin V production